MNEAEFIERLREQLYRANYRLLEPAQRLAIEARLAKVRLLDWVIEKISRTFEQEIAEEIEAAGGAEQVH